MYSFSISLLGISFLYVFIFVSLCTTVLKSLVYLVEIVLITHILYFIEYKQLTEDKNEEEIDLLKLFPSLHIRDSDMDFPDEFYGSESSEDAEADSD